MKVSKFLFRHFYDIEIENVFLYKPSIRCMGLYRNKHLMGFMKEPGSDVAIKPLLRQIETIFPTHQLNLPIWKKNKTNIGIYTNVNPSHLHYFDANDNEVPKEQGKFMLSKYLWNIEPLGAYLKKSDTMVCGLYLGSALLGVLLSDDKKLSFKDLFPYIENILPNDWTHLDDFIKKNDNRIDYYCFREAVYFDAKGNVLYSFSNPN